MDGIADDGSDDDRMHPEIQRGEAMLLAGQAGAAFAAFQGRLAVRSGSVAGHLGAAAALPRLDRPLEALAHYDAVSTVQPGHWVACYGRGAILQRASRLVDALAAYDQALASTPDPVSVQIARGDLLLNLSEPRAALSAFEAALAADANSVRALTGRGAALVHLDRFEAAASAYTVALNVDPNSAEVHAGLGCVWLVERQAAKALEAFDRCLRSAPLSPRPIGAAGRPSFYRMRWKKLLDRIERTGITARLDSPQSLWLREIFEAQRAYIVPEIARLLSNVDLYGVDLDIIDANPRQPGPRRQIIVFSGLIRIVRYYAQVTRVLHELPINRPGRMFPYRGAERQESAAFSDAAMSIMADYLISGRAPPRFDSLLAPRARAHAENGCVGAMLFVLFHELGHLEHGHLRDGFERFERPPVALLLDEAIDEYQNAEFQADQFAYLAFVPEIREVMMSSVLFFLGPHSFLEAFARGSDSHPFAINRAGQMAGLIPQASETGRIVADIARKRAEGYRNLAARRELGGGDIRFRIQETLPAAEAHAIVSGITRRVLSETGPLEAAD